MAISWMTRAATAIVWCLAVVGCGATAVAQPRVDGWPIGPVVDCAALAVREIGRVEQPGCERIIRAAMDDPRLAGWSVDDVLTSGDVPTIHELDLIDEEHRRIVVARSGANGDYVVAFSADDGPIVVGVWCGAGIEPDVCGRWDAPPW